MDSSDNLVWHANLTAAMSVWRPTATGYTEVVRFQLAVHLPIANEELLYVASNIRSDTIVARPLHLVTVQRGDIIGVTLSPKATAAYIPLLLMKSSASDHESGEQEGCGDINATRNCNIVSDKMPIIAVNVTNLQGKSCRIVHVSMHAARIAKYRDGFAQCCGEYSILYTTGRRLV